MIWGFKLAVVRVLLPYFLVAMLENVYTSQEICNSTYITNIDCCMVCEMFASRTFCAIIHVD